MEQTLQQLLEQATADCNAFLELLDHEQQALIDSNMPMLEQLLSDKTPLLQRLSSQDQQLLAISQNAGTSLAELVTQTGDAALQQLHQQFVAAALACRDANQRNARLIHHSQNSTRQLLDLLRNQGESSRNLYDRQGLTASSPGSRTISKA